MSSLSALVVLALLPLATDPPPNPDDVKAGWTAFVIFLLLALAVAFLGWSLTKQLRRVESARRAGVYGDEPEVDEPPVVDSTTTGSDRGPHGRA